MVKIKICGLKTMEDIRMVNRQRLDFAGFVFAGSKRRITPEQAAEMKKELLPEIRSVGVFVNEDPARIAGLAESGVLDYIQLHGDEDGEEIRWINDYHREVYRTLAPHLAQEEQNWLREATAAEKV